MSATRASSIAGFLFAVGSTACFALSGICAAALMEAGWTAGAAVTTRIVLAALVLLIPTLIALKGLWHLVRQAWRTVLLFGLLAIAGVQLTFFLAIMFIPPSLALLIEYMGPVLLMLWSWARTRVSPGGITLLGALLAVLGLLAISGAVVLDGINPLGIIFALIAALGLAAYYAVGARADHGIPPLPFVGLGLLVGAVALVLVSAVGLLPFTVTSELTVLAGNEVPAWLTVAIMVLVSTVIAYVLGVTGSRYLGAIVSSFTGYSETLFGILWTILLLAIVPTGMQWLGAALIVAGVVTVKIGEIRRSRQLAAARAMGTAPSSVG